MSYDLYFYKRNNSQQTEEQIAEYLTKNLPYNISDHPRQWEYENPAPGVYFLIDWNEPEEEQERIEIFDNFPDFKYLNFNFSINFFRPRFFGLEIFPIIDKLINDLDLFVLNLQDGSDNDIPRKFPGGYFQQQWIAHNDQVTIENFNELKFEYLTLEKSNYIWWYQFHRESFQNSLTEDIFIPGYFILKNKEDGQLYTACVWPDHISIIIPPVDFVIVQKAYKKFFKTVEESSLVPFDKILNEFKEEFEGYEHEIPNLKVFRNTGSDKIKKKFNSLQLGKSIKEFGQVVGLDSFVNARP